MLSARREDNLSRAVEGSRKAGGVSDGDEKRVLGDEHPDTLTSIINLVFILIG